MKLPQTKESFLNKYWLKAELVTICSEYDLPKSGSKQDLIEYICDFIEGKPINKKKPVGKPRCISSKISFDTLIDINYSNDEKHRTFFRQAIGPSFKYNVQFMAWMKINKGKKTYKEAVAEWVNIDNKKKNGKKYEIGKQFEYNQYTRDFFTDNPGKTKEDCIKCWNYKKSQAGSHKYCREDLNNL